MPTLRNSCCTIHLFLVLCGRLTPVATDAALTSPLPTSGSLTNAGTFSPTTPAPGGVSEKQEPSVPPVAPEAVIQDPASSTTNTNPTTGIPEAVIQDPASSTTNTNPTTGIPEAVIQDPASSTTNTNPTTGIPEAVPQDPVSSTTNTIPTTGTPEAVSHHPGSSRTNTNLTPSAAHPSALAASRPTTSAPGGVSEKQKAPEPTGTPAAGTQDPASSVASTSPATGPTEDPASSTANATNLTQSDAPTALPSTTALTTEAPLLTTTKPVVIPDVCLCDLTPDFCDLGCCCDVVDCGVLDLRTVFTGCQERPMSGVCVEKWLMFRANVDPALVTVSEALFCVRPADNVTAPQALPARPQNAALRDSYHFSAPRPVELHTRGFYRVDDVILTHFTAAFVRGLLRQPSPGPASSSCVNRNPAHEVFSLKETKCDMIWRPGFLRSGSLSCSRSVTPQSCSSDSSLRAASYSSDLSLFKLPVPETLQVTRDLLIPVSPAQSDWPTPREENGSCLNVVSQVQFVVRYSSAGELTEAVVDVVFTDVDLSGGERVLLSQTHSVQFQLATPHPTPGGPIPAVGLRAGSPVIGRFGGTAMPLTVLGASRGGQCSSEPSARAPLLFTHNTASGCFFSSPSSDCYELRSELYGLLQGPQGAAPHLLAMSSGPQPDWTTVITQRCAESPQETCEAGCLLPLSLSIQVLWARQGLLDQPQSYILGAKYLFHCQTVQCPLSSPLTVTAEVLFVDTTVYPEAPRGAPQPDWRFPFGFFSRGAAELDGQTASAGYSNHGDGFIHVVAGVALVTVTMVTGLFTW